MSNAGNNAAGLSLGLCHW